MVHELVKLVLLNFSYSTQKWKQNSAIISETHLVMYSSRTGPWVSKRFEDCFYGFGHGGAGLGLSFDLEVEGLGRCLSVLDLDFRIDN